MFLIVELTQKMSVTWSVCEDISSKHFFRPKFNVNLLLLI